MKSWAGYSSWVFAEEEADYSTVRDRPSDRLPQQGNPCPEAAEGLREYVADLHIHSVLSPCGDLEMSPSAIVCRAQQVSLSLIALTDHNRAENCPALHDAAAEVGLPVLYGLEVRTQEEVDVLCLFDRLSAALDWQEALYPALPAVANAPLLFGDQVVVDRYERILKVEPKLLINAVAISLQSVVHETVQRGGLVIAAHVDRPVNSLISQLGFPPSGCPLDAAEVSPFGREEEVRSLHSAWRQIPLVRFSDAHQLDQIGKQHTVFRVNCPTVKELRLALRGEKGRSFQAIMGSPAKPPFQEER